MIAIVHLIACVSVCVRVYVYVRVFPLGETERSRKGREIKDGNNREKENFKK